MIRYKSFENKMKKFKNKVREGKRINLSILFSRFFFLIKRKGIWGFIKTFQSLPN